MIVLSIIAVAFFIALVLIVLTCDFEDKRTFEEWRDDQW